MILFAWDTHAIDAFSAMHVKMDGLRIIIFPDEFVFPQNRLRRAQEALVSCELIGVVNS